MFSFMFYLLNMFEIHLLFREFGYLVGKDYAVLPLSNCPAHPIFTPNSSAALIAHLGFLIMARARKTASA
jgi:hypothetical protein